MFTAEEEQRIADLRLELKAIRIMLKGLREELGRAVRSGEGGNKMRLFRRIKNTRTKERMLIDKIESRSRAFLGL